MDNEELKGWQELLAFVDKHPDLAPDSMFRYIEGVVFTKACSISDRTEALNVLAATARAMSPCEKKDGYTGAVQLVKGFSGGVSLRFSLVGACERVVVGTRRVPASAAHEVDDVEYHCPPSVLAGTD